MDDIDRAQEAETLLRQNAIDKILHPRSVGARCDAPAFCLECGAVIPEARRLALPDCALCVKCQRALERSSRR